MTGQPHVGEAQEFCVLSRNAFADAVSCLTVSGDHNSFPFKNTQSIAERFLRERAPHGLNVASTDASQRSR